jgi:hypothetical protein
LGSINCAEIARVVKGTGFSSSAYAGMDDLVTMINLLALVAIALAGVIWLFAAPP